MLGDFVSRRLSKRAARYLILVGLLAGSLSGCYGAGVTPTRVQPAVTQLPVIHYPADNVWAFLASSPELYLRFDSLGAAARGSDTVVVGRIVAFDKGGSFRVPGSVPEWHAIARIKPEMTLTGAPKIDSAGSIAVEFVLVVGGDAYPDKEFADLEASLPNGSALLFLQSWATYFARAGAAIPDGFQALDSGSIYRTVGGDGAIRIENGLLSPPSYAQGWPIGLGALPLTTVITQIKSAATAS